MENYFNYFTEIEEHFQRRRGVLTLLSPLDWSLIESFQEAAVPLETVLKGIDLAFERLARRKDKIQKVNSLAYCTQSILKEHERMREAVVGKSVLPGEPARRKSADSDKENLILMLWKAAIQLKDSIQQAAGKEKTFPSEVLCGVAKTLEEIRAEVASAHQIDYEKLESRLSLLEEKILASLVAWMDDSRQMTLRIEITQEINRHRRQLRTEQIAMVEKKMVQKKLFDQFCLPRLSLFYLPLN